MKLQEKIDEFKGKLDSMPNDEINDIIKWNQEGTPNQRECFAIGATWAFEKVLSLLEQQNINSKV